MSRTYRNQRTRGGGVFNYLTAREQKGNSVPLSKRNIAREGKQGWFCRPRNCSYCLSNKMHRHRKRMLDSTPVW